MGLALEAEPELVVDEPEPEAEAEAVDVLPDEREVVEEDLVVDRRVAELKVPLVPEEPLPAEPPEGSIVKLLFPPAGEVATAG